MNHNKTTLELADAMAQRLLTAAQVLDMPAPEWLVEGVLPAEGLGVLFGSPGSYKSFLALDLGCCVASGAPFMLDFPVKQGRVLYVAAEGRSGMSIRLEAWMQHFGVPELADFFLYPQAINLTDERYGPAIVELCRTLKPRLVVFDTLARSMAGSDENSTRDMGRLMETIDQIRQVASSSVLLVHHTTKNGENYRGNSALEGAMDSMVRMSREEATGLLTLTCTKQKDGEEFRPVTLYPEVVTVRGGLTTSCVLKSSGRRMISRILDARESAILATFISAPPGIEFTANQLADTAGVDRRNIYKIVKSLLTKGFLIQTKEGYGARWALNPSKRTEVEHMIHPESSEVIDPPENHSSRGVTRGNPRDDSQDESGKGQTSDPDDEAPPTLECEGL